MALWLLEVFLLKDHKCTSIFFIHSNTILQNLSDYNSMCFLESRPIIFVGSFPDFSCLFFC